MERENTKGELLETGDLVYCIDLRMYPKELTKGKRYYVMDLGGGPDEGAILIRNDSSKEEWYNESRFSKYDYKYPPYADVVFDDFAKVLVKKDHASISDRDGRGGYIFNFFPEERRLLVLSEEHITGLYGEKLEEKPVESDGDKKPSGLQKAIRERVLSNALDAASYVFDPASVTPVNDPVLHPSHYNQGGIEAIDALEAATCNLYGWKATLTYQSMKYLWRWNEKGKPLEDLKKARFYLDRLISKVEKETKEEK